MGRRLVEVGGVLGNTYETPLAQLDLVCAYKLSPRITFKAGVMNILNNDNSEVSLINEREDLSSSDAKGITFSLGASSSF